LFNFEIRCNKYFRGHTLLSCFIQRLSPRHTLSNVSNKKHKTSFRSKNDTQKVVSKKKVRKRHFRQKSIFRNVVRANGHRQNLQPRNVLFFTISVIDKLLNSFSLYCSLPILPTSRPRLPSCTKSLKRFISWYILLQISFIIFFDSEK